MYWTIVLFGLSYVLLVWYANTLKLLIAAEEYTAGAVLSIVSIFSIPAVLNWAFTSIPGW